MNNDPATEPKPNKPLTTKEATQDKGLSGTLIYSGVITNEEYNKSLVGVQGYKTYDIMRRSDSTVRQALQIVKLPILSATREVKPFQDEDGNISDKAQEVADFVEEQLFNKINFDQFLKEGLNCFDFGFSIFEKVYQPTTFNGKTYIGLSKLSSRKQLSVFKWETEDGQAGITQWVGGKNASIPRNKLVVFTYDLEGENWAGISLLRSIYKDWDIKDKLVLVNAMALEKHGMGMPIVRERDGQTAAPGDQEEAEEVLSQMRANERSFMKIPKTMEIEMLDMKGNTTKEIIPTLNYHDSRIMSGVLARFMEVGGSSGSGSQSLVKELTSIFMKAEESFARQFASQVFEDVIKQLCDLNFTDMETVGYPTLNFSDIADDDTTILAQALNQLATANLLTPDPDLENNLRNRFNIPEMSKEMHDQYENAIAEGALPGGATTTAVVQAARDKFSETNDPREALKAAREVRDHFIDILNGV